MTSENVQKCGGSQDCHEKNHICRLIIGGDLERVKKLVRDTQYYCKNCGRSAHDKENLCNPSKL